MLSTIVEFASSSGLKSLERFFKAREQIVFGVETSNPKKISSTFVKKKLVLPELPTPAATSKCHIMHSLKVTKYQNKHGIFEWFYLKPVLLYNIECFRPIFVTCNIAFFHARMFPVFFFFSSYILFYSYFVYFLFCSLFTWVMDSIIHKKQIFGVRLYWMSVCTLEETILNVL